jgi:hypothetical protein
VRGLASLAASALAIAALAACRHSGPVGNPAPGVPGPAAVPPAAVARVGESLARQLGVAPGDLVLVGWQAMTWADAALGCPQPGVLYAQATVPGYRLVFRTPGGTALEISSDESGRRWVQCTDGRLLRSAPTP